MFTVVKFANESQNQIFWTFHCFGFCINLAGLDKTNVKIGQKGSSITKYNVFKKTLAALLSVLFVFQLYIWAQFSHSQTENCPFNITCMVTFSTPVITTLEEIGFSSCVFTQKVKYEPYHGRKVCVSYVIIIVIRKPSPQIALRNFWTVMKGVASLFAREMKLCVVVAERNYKVEVTECFFFNSLP